MTSQPWPKLSQQTLADEVYHAVRTRILNGNLAPGEFLREQEISSALGVSRTPVREALSRLAIEGFLERLPHRGFRVPDESMSTLLELYPIVSALELLAGRLAFSQLSETEIADLKRVNRRLNDARKEGDVRKLIELDNEFHRIIDRASGSQRLLDLLEDLRSQVRRLELWYYSESNRSASSIEGHAELIRAIEEGNHDDALELLETNMWTTYRQLLSEEDGPPTSSGLREFLVDETDS